MNLDYVQRMHIGFSIAIGVNQLAPCFSFSDSGDIDKRYEFFPKLENATNPWHIGTLDSATYPDPHDLVQAEIELLSFLFSLVLQAKPVHVFESGTNVGLAARAMAAGCWVNGFGLVTTCDTDDRMVKYAMSVCEGLPIVVENGPALESPVLPIADLVFIDSSYESRIKEVEVVKPGALVVVHDTYAERWMREALKDFEAVHVDGPRGFSLGRKK